MFERKGLDKGIMLELRLRGCMMGTKMGWEDGISRPNSIPRRFMGALTVLNDDISIMYIKNRLK
jgi:hypothetical protein